MPYTKKMIYFENMAWMTALSKDNTCIILKLFLLKQQSQKSVIRITEEFLISQVFLRAWGNLFEKGRDI